MDTHQHSLQNSYSGINVAVQCNLKYTTIYYVHTANNNRGPTQQAFGTV